MWPIDGCENDSSLIYSLSFIIGLKNYIIPEEGS